jgi:molecular chaperone GrpE
MKTGDEKDGDAKEPELRVVDRRWWARGEETPDADVASRKPTVVEDLELRLADASNQLQTYLIEHRRSLEEFEQVKARLRRDVAREVERGKRAVLVELLDVVDNLDRAIAAASANDASAGGGDEAVAPAASGPVTELARGVRIVRDQFLAKLEGFGVVRVPALGERFDAARHEAVTTAAVTDPAKDGIVVSVIREAYAIGGDLLRPASVVVGTLSNGAHEASGPHVGQA